MEENEDEDEDEEEGEDEDEDEDEEDEDLDVSFSDSSSVEFFGPEEDDDDDDEVVFDGPFDDDGEVEGPPPLPLSPPPTQPSYNHLLLRSSIPVGTVVRASPKEAFLQRTWWKSIRNSSRSVQGFKAVATAAAAATSSSTTIIFCLINRAESWI
ncbi:hypothetical protein TYRP_020238 [Tyrophagus putrescentiae]|nr:hypothetical protein TYRP_020238 [Tyrophagus putrescentiae]